MGILRNYFCCLCRDRMPRDELHGIRWTGKRFVKTDSHSTERHLCQNCLDSAEAVAKEYRAMRGPTGGESDA